MSGATGSSLPRTLPAEDKTPAAATGYNNGRYDLQQQTFCMSMLTCLSFNITGSTTEAITAKFRTLVENVLSNAATKELIGNWKLVWGPVVYADAFVGAKASVNSMFIAAPEDHPEQVVVAIAGTNGISLFGWMIEDFNVREKVAWPYAQTTLQPHLSKGIAFGLGKLQALAEPPGKSGGPATARDFLAAHPGISDVMVTGHSLGGALAAAYSLFLDDTRAEWDPAKRISIRCLDTAGQSPGDADFSRYFGERLGTATRRVWNQLDVVPHAFHRDTMARIPTLYVPNIASQRRVEKLIHNLRTETAANNYLNILPDAEGFPSRFLTLHDIAGEKYKTFVDFINSVVKLIKLTNPFRTHDVMGTIDFAVHGLIQHLFPYFSHLGIDEFIHLMCSPATQAAPKAENTRA
jgi:hypothetical protein